jgi:HAD superfamily hydrolase (TIGR01509 family)
VISVADRPKIAAVIFDCDGTLVESEGPGNRVLPEYIREFGLEITAEQAVEAFRGRKLADCLAEVEERLGMPLPAEFVPEFRRRTATAFRDELLPMPGALELVGSLAIPYCVASSGPREKIELSLSITGLLPLFTGRIISSYEVDSWKPDPGLFLHAARMMNVSPDECAVVEDSLPGFEAGLAAGMRVFALCGPQQPTPDVIIRLEHLAQLKQYLGS